jgi:hypothetical protein
MGEFWDMGIPAQVVKKNPAQAASHVPIFAHTGKIFIYESLHNKHFFGFFNFQCFFLSNRCHQRVATQIPKSSEISEIPPMHMDQKLSMQQDLPPWLGPPWAN